MVIVQYTPIINTISRWFAFGFATLPQRPWVVVFFFGDFLGCNDWGTRGYHTYVAILVNSPGI